MQGNIPFGYPSDTPAMLPIPRRSLVGVPVDPQECQFVLTDRTACPWLTVFRQRARRLDPPGPVVLNGLSSPDLSAVPLLVSLSSSRAGYAINRDFPGWVREEADSYQMVFGGREDRGNQRGSQINYRFPLMCGQQDLDYSS